LPRSPRKQGIELSDPRDALKILHAGVLHHVFDTAGADALMDALASDPAAAVDRQNSDDARPRVSTESLVKMFIHRGGRRKRLFGTAVETRRHPYGFQCSPGPGRNDDATDTRASRDARESGAEIDHGLHPMIGKLLEDRPKPAMRRLEGSSASVSTNSSLGYRWRWRNFLLSRVFTVWFLPQFHDPKACGYHSNAKQAREQLFSREVCEDFSRHTTQDGENEQLQHCDREPFEKSQTPLPTEPNHESKRGAHHSEQLYAD
jgi:hypothetical protein